MAKVNKVITNSTPIIGLSILKKLHLIADLFDEVYVPDAVYQEVVHCGSPRRYGRNELHEMIDNGIFNRYKVKNGELVNKLYGKMHKGELEVIVGAKELNIRIVVMDENTARSLAKTFLLQPIGTIGILILAKKKGRIEKVKPHLDILINHGFHISKVLYEKAIFQVDER